MLLASHSAALLSSDFAGVIQLCYTQAFPLSYCFANVILLCHCHDPLPVMLLLGLCHTTLPVMLPANLMLHCKYHKACHCQVTVPLSSVFAALMLYCHAHATFTQSYHLAIVMLLCHCHAAWPLLYYVACHAVRHYHTTWPLSCCLTLS